MKRGIIYNLLIVCTILCILPLIILLFIAELGILWTYLFLITIPSMVLTIYTILYIRKRIIRPLRYLIDEANSISSGDLSHTIEYKTNDEIGDFISAFDHMRSTLYEQQQQQQQFEIDRKNFIDSISHDLKTPLASISAYIEALQDGIVATPEEEQQYLKVIENKVSVLTELSNQLSMSYKSHDTLSLSLQEVNCLNWTTDFYNDIEVECQLKNISPIFSNYISLKDKVYMRIDICQLDRAIQNILSNSFRYYHQYLAITTEIKNNQFVLSIKNDGAKLSANNMSKIFDRFYTEESLNNEGHLGLGLYISKTIINAMNGEIQATKELGIIEFKIMLPIYRLKVSEK